MEANLESDKRLQEMKIDRWPSSSLISAFIVPSVLVVVIVGKVELEVGKDLAADGLLVER